MLVVCDTNIIIDFSKINLLYLLKDVFGNVIVAHEVKDELLAGEEPGTAESSIISALDEWIKVKDVENRLAVESLEVHMGTGEAASIVLFRQTKADILAVNDLKARGIAQSMGMKVIGTLGILRIAKDRGLLKQIKPQLDALRKAGAYISNDLCKRMLKDVGEI